MAGEKIRVLIVDDIAETRENIRKLLQFESDIEVVGAARSGREAIESAKEQKPDVVLMDINMPDIDGITATETIRRNTPFIQVVILSVQGDPNYMRRAMLAGARDYLTKPPALDELIKAIRQAGKVAFEERQKAINQVQVSTPSTAGAGPLSLATGKIIVVYSPKGGTGCTTLAVNLATTLCADEKNVVLVDANLQFGDVAVFLKEHPRNTVADLAPRSEELDPEYINEVMIYHAASGLKVLAAPAKPEQAEQVSGDQFQKILQYLRRMFKYIIVDTSSTLTDPVLAAMDEADILVLVTTQEIPAIKSARLFLDLVDILKLNRRRILFIMNHYDRNTKITPEQVGDTFKHGVVGVIPADDRVLVSVTKGVPFMPADRTPLGKSFMALVDAIKNRLVEFEEVIPGAARK